VQKQSLQDIDIQTIIKIKIERLKFDLILADIDFVISVKQNRKGGSFMGELSVEAIGATKGREVKPIEESNDQNKNPISVHGTEIIKEEAVAINGKNLGLPKFPSYGELKAYFGSNSAADKVQDAYQGIESRMQIAYDNFKSKYPNENFTPPQLKPITEFRDGKKGADNYINYLNQYEMLFNNAIENARDKAHAKNSESEGEKTRKAIAQAAEDINDNSNLNTRLIMDQGDENTQVIKSQLDETQNTVQEEGFKTRSTVKNEGTATRETVQEEGLKTRLNEESTRRLIRNDGANTRYVVIDTAKNTQEKVEKEATETRKTVEADGDKTRTKVDAESTSIKRTIMTK